MILSWRLLAGDDSRLLLLLQKLTLPYRSLWEFHWILNISTILLLLLLWFFSCFFAHFLHELLIHHFQIFFYLSFKFDVLLSVSLFEISISLSFFFDLSSKFILILFVYVEIQIFLAQIWFISQIHFLVLTSFSRTDNVSLWVTHRCSAATLSKLKIFLAFSKLIIWFRDLVSLVWLTARGIRPHSSFDFLIGPEGRIHIRLIVLHILKL